MLVLIVALSVKLDEPMKACSFRFLARIVSTGVIGCLRRRRSRLRQKILENTHHQG
jgi:hypothetical protein